MSEIPTTYILPAEHLGEAAIINGKLEIGGVLIPWNGPASVYVRRLSSDLSVAEIALARHDGLAQEQLDEQNRQAEIYPLGPREYWRSEMVGRYRYGPDMHLMTDADFETEFDEDDDYDE